MLLKSLTAFSTAALVATAASANVIVADFDGNGILAVQETNVVDDGTGNNVAELTLTDSGAAGFDRISRATFNFGALCDEEREAVFSSIPSAQAFAVDYSFIDTSADPLAANGLSIAFTSFPNGTTNFFELSETVSIAGTTSGTAIFNVTEADLAGINEAVPTGFFFFDVFSNRAAGASGTIQIDNIAVVPEPASLALLGVGGLAMLRRNRG